MAPLSGLVLVGALSVIVKIAIDAIKPAVAPLVDALRIPETVNPYLYIGLLLGLTGAGLFEANALASFGFPADTPARITFGIVLTGIIAGRGSNFTHNAVGTVAEYLARFTQ